MKPTLVFLTTYLALNLSLLGQTDLGNKLSMATLTSGEWVATFGGHVAFFLTFHPDHHYERKCGGECGPGISGNPTFEINLADSTIHLSGDPKSYELYSESTSCTFLYDEAALEYRRGLHCDNHLVYYDQKSISIGILTKHDGIPVITMGIKNGVTTQNVRVRSAPSITSPEIEYCMPKPNIQFGLEGPKVEDLDCFLYMPKGTELIILARTVNKEHVRDWNNYWYLIQYQDYKNGIKTHWVFGEFIESK